MMNSSILASRFMKASMEEASPVEMEYTFYGRVRDLRNLYKLAIRSERQEQWQTPLGLDKGVKARIRKTNDSEYTLTTKEKNMAGKGSLENTAIITEGLYNSLKKVSENGYIKTRYVIPIPGTNLLWEVDVFKNNQGQDSDWVKIDLEVPAIDTALPKDLPVPFIEFISHQSKSLTPEEKAKIDELWESHWQRLDYDVNE